MKQFIKENVFSILFLSFMGLMLILLGRIMIQEFSVHATQKHLVSTQDRVRCLEHFGWQVDITSEVEESAYIPEEFDNVWMRYNEIQRMSGFDLLPYRGKSALRYTYRVLNFPGDPQVEAFVNLYVLDGNMIAGDCMTVALDGFMLPVDIRSVP